MTSQPGNAGANSAFYLSPDDPFGTCYPTLVFTRLVPEPWSDPNEEADSNDSPFLHDPMTQADLYLRAMCEGFVDGETSTDYACRLGIMSVFDFSYESLCVQAFGGRAVSPLPAALREDRSEGFGPMPATFAYAEVFNQLVSAVNLLTRARVMLPMTLESAIGEGTITKWVQARNPDGSALTCFGGSQVAQLNCLIPDPTPDFSTPTWYAGASGSIVQASLTGNCDGSGLWELVIERRDAMHRWSPTDPDAIDALPEGIRTYLHDHPVVLFLHDQGKSPVVGTLTTDIDGSSGCCDESDAPCPGTWAVGDGTWWIFQTELTSTAPCEVGIGLVSAPPLESGQFAYARLDDGTTCRPGPANYQNPTAISDQTAVIAIPVDDLPTEADPA